MVELCFNLGGLVVSLRMLDGEISPEGNYKPFIISAPAQVKLVHKNVGTIPEPGDWEECFFTGGLATFYRKETLWLVDLHSPVTGSEPYRRLVFDDQQVCGEIITRIRPRERESGPFPLQYPIGEILASHLIDRMDGFVIHACAVKDGDHGYLFSGFSGAGKSTTAKIWSSIPGVKILNDDRVVVRKINDRYFMQGTPWHGDVNHVSDQVLPLQKIFILKHNPVNDVAALTPAQLAKEIFLRTFPAYWDPLRVDLLLGMLDDFCGEIPGYELGFVPDSRMVDFVRNL